MKCLSWEMGKEGDSGKKMRKAKDNNIKIIKSNFSLRCFPFSVYTKSCNADRTGDLAVMLKTDVLFFLHFRIIINFHLFYIFSGNVKILFCFVCSFQFSSIFFVVFPPLLVVVVVVFVLILIKNIVLKCINSLVNKQVFFTATSSQTSSSVSPPHSLSARPGQQPQCSILPVIINYFQKKKD